MWTTPRLGATLRQHARMRDAWTKLAQTQHGAILISQLYRSGCSPAVVKRLTAAGTLAPVSRGVFMIGGAPTTWLARAWCGVLATGGIVCLRSAGRLWCVIDVTDDAPIDVLLRHERRVHMPRGVRVYRTVRPRGPVAVVDGLPVTSRSWTVLDLLGTLPPAGASRLADRAIQQGWLTTEEVHERLRCHPRRRGNTQLRRIAAQLGDGAAAESERRLHALLRRARIPGWCANHAVRVEGRIVAVIDVAIPDRMVAIEVDGMAYHVDVDSFRHDRRRQNELVALGWTVLRFTWADLTERPGYVIATIRRALPDGGSVRARQSP